MPAARRIVTACRRNGDDCGNNEMDSAKRADLVRKNGGGSNYYFSLVALPAN